MLGHNSNRKSRSEELKKEQKKERELETKDNQHVFLKKPFFNEKKYKKRLYIV